MPHKRTSYRSFAENLSELQNYVETNGTLSIPNHFVTETGFALATWIMNVKAAWKAGTLKPDRVAALEALGYAPPNRNSIPGAIKAIRKFAKKHGHVRPGPDVVIDGYKLRLSIYYIRKRYFCGKLSVAEIEKLMDLGVILDRHLEGIAALKSFIGEFGHANVPPSYENEYFPLRTWLDQMRSKWRRGQLDGGEIAELESLGVTPEIRRDFFEEGIRVLEAIKEKTGSAYVSERHVEDGMNIGAWVRDRRKEWRRGKLTPERAARMTALGYSAFLGTSHELLASAA
jgi:hypothetical protein